MAIVTAVAEIAGKGGERAQEFSHWMIDLLHGPTGSEPDAEFHHALRQARLDSLRERRSHQDFFAENYVGI